MDNAFDPHAIEQDLYAEWEQRGHFAPRGNGKPYCIMIPPPNITGSLHMGHAFQHTVMDALIRYHRMKGNQTLWQMGTDHAGISTQMVVENQLLAQGLSRDDLGREAFVDKVWEWREKSGGTISEQLRRMGSSLDWSRDRFTMDDGFSTAVLEVFVRLYDEGLIYRGTRLVNWDPVLQTAISDLEVESEDEQGHLWHFRYPLSDGATTSDGKDYVVVATTRPETMLGDTAVAVHPDDVRYHDLVGKQVLLPLAERLIPIIADEHVDPEFGSGCVKITPGHDFNDYEIGERHALPVISIFNKDATLNDEVPEAYRGLDRFEARKRVVADLDAKGLLNDIENHTLPVPRAERSGAVVEPFITEQWFVKIKPLAEPAIEAVEDGRIEFIPKRYENTYFAWMREFRDWCISRQLWWGHRIPAWYDKDGNVYVGRNEKEVRKKHNLGRRKLTQDPDVLDTWFSSALWTFGTLGWPEKTEELERYHPTDVLVTGHDIITFWVAKMIMMTLKFVGEIPFRKVYIHGLVSDAEGKKMSKSRGNGLDPLDLIDGITVDELVAKRTEDLMQPSLAEGIERATRRDYPDGIPSYGTDALRFTYCALATRASNIAFDVGRIEGYQHFCNKLWNAARFVLQNTEDEELGTASAAEYGLADRWIRSQLQRMLDDVSSAIERYRFDLVANALYEFIWHEYCDWYIELAKPVLWDENTSEARLKGTRRTLLEVLETLLRALHPVMPFITETLWRKVAKLLEIPGETVMLQEFPEPAPGLVDAEAEDEIQWLKGIVTAIRNIRGEQNIAPSKTIAMLIQSNDESDRDRLEAHHQFLAKLAKLESAHWVADGESTPAAAAQIVDGMKILVPLAGLIDVDAELVRLDKELGRRRNDLDRANKKLGNDSFVAKAPEAVVAKERTKASELSSAIADLEAQRKQLAELE
jgi:valyl-tRNA synthetase